MIDRKVKYLNIVYAIIFLSAILICYLRTSYAILYPVMYTEDATWSGRILKNGFIDTCVNAKGSYLVIGNIILLQLALLLNSMIFGKNLVYLPVFVAIVSYLYYAVLAWLPFRLFKNLLNQKARVILFYAILLLPMGTSISEIYGRISNIGYGCFFISFVLMVWFLFEECSESIGKRIIAYLTLLLCSVTNPVCYIIFAVVLCVHLKEAFSKYKLKMNWETMLIFVSGGVMCCFVLIMFLHKHKEIGQSNADIIFENMIEFFFRSCAYIFVWPFYNLMNNVIAVLVITIIVAFFGVSIYLIKDKKYRKLLNVSYFATIFFSLITLFMRKTLTTQLVNYTTSFPDRYFYVQELLVLFDFCIILSALFEKKIENNAWKKMVYSICVYLVVLNICNIDKIFELSHSGYVDCSVTFAKSIESAYLEQGEQMEYKVLTPSKYSIWMPKDYMDASIYYIRENLLTVD